MNKIYCVFKNYQMTDGDGWAHWVQQEILGYYSSLKKAESAVQVFIAKAIKERLDQIAYVNSRNPGTYSETNIKSEIDILTANIVGLSEGDNGRGCEDYTLFNIRKITVL